jgi:methyl-accepting chemotaxis protein
MGLNDLKLRTKTVIPVAIMGLMLIAMVVLGASQLNDVSSEAGNLIENRDTADLELSRAIRSVVVVPYSVFGSVMYDSESAGGKAAAEDFRDVNESANQKLDHAAALLPDKASEINAFKARFGDLMKAAKIAFDAGSGVPGADHGRDLKPDELDALGKAARLAQEVDLESRALVKDLSAFNSALNEANVKASAQLRADSALAITELVIMGGLAVLLAGGFAFWISSAKIARPLLALSKYMKALAAGELSVEIEGLERRDEVGEMAQSVQVFKQNAVDRAKAEEAATSSRALVDAERERAAAEKSRGAETVAAAIQALGEGLRKLAAGDLTTRLDQGFSGELARVRDDFNTTVEKLAETLRAVVGSTKVIQVGTREISISADDLSQRTEQQAASLEETAAALEEITQTLKKSAEGARHAAEVVSNADGDAKKGAVVVRQAVEAMDAIARSSAQIGQIIGVIDEIAFQTNLLALNAGVEAARAGDAGKGFAVVASEVRALAQRSAEAAKEIKGLISTSTAQVGSGVALVAESGKSLERIISQVSEINRVVADIAAGAQEQSTGLSQVNSAINQMDQSTQQNATMVQETTVASHSLTKETTQLAGLVDQFRVGDAVQNSLRRELEKAAPHAFAKPATPPARPAVRGETRAAPRRAKSVANGSAAAADDSWGEF